MSAPVLDYAHREALRLIRAGAVVTVLGKGVEIKTPDECYRVGSGVLRNLIAAGLITPDFKPTEEAAK